MPQSRFYLEDTLQINGEIALPVKVAHHARAVLRMQEHDDLILFNGQGGEYAARIVSINKKELRVQILGFRDIDCESPLAITLVQGISKGQKMDFTLQKAVELGVSKIVPIRNQRSNVKLQANRKESRMQHWQQIIISACEQCGRNSLPELLKPLTVDEWLEQDNNPRKLILLPEGDGDLSVLSKSRDSISLMIGSEGGFNQLEIDQAMNCGYQAMAIGPRILRTETAALVALSVCQTLWGDFAGHG